jgi:hypothetical protein
MFLFYIYFFFLTFLWLLYSCENWIDLNCILPPLHLNTKPQIDSYISSLVFYILALFLTFQYHHNFWPFKVYQQRKKWKGVWTNGHDNFHPINRNERRWSDQRYFRQLKKFIMTKNKPSSLFYIIVYIKKYIDKYKII